MKIDQQLQAFACCFVHQFELISLQSGNCKKLGTDSLPVNNDFFDVDVYRQIEEPSTLQFAFGVECPVQEISVVRQVGDFQLLVRVD